MEATGAMEAPPPAAVPQQAEGREEAKHMGNEAAATVVLTEAGAPNVAGRAPKSGGNKNNSSLPSPSRVYASLDYNDPAWDEPPPAHEPVDMESERVTDLVPRLRDMLRLRDQALQGERKQVRLYEAKNEALRANLDQVEAEVGSLQAALTEANDKISASLKERRRLEKRIASLESMLSGVKGQEYAINVATSQNTKLVLLLQQEERKQKELEKERQGHLDEIGGLKAKLHSTTREASAVEAKLKDQFNRRSYQFDKLQVSHDHLKVEHAQLVKKYEEETADLQAKVSTLDRQVHQLKGQPYKLLDRLQNAEDTLRVARDDCERVQREVVILEEQNMELSRHLEDATKKGNEYKERMEFLQKSVPTLEKELASLRSRLDFERHDKAALEKQLFDMSQTITQLVQRQAVVEEKSIHKENELSRLLRGKDKEGKVQDQQLSAKDRMLAKQHETIAVLEEALAAAKAEAEAARVHAKTSMEASDPALPYKLEVQTMARRRLLDLHVHCVSTLTIAEPEAEVIGQALRQLQHLDLSTCAMTDAELATLLQTLRLCPEVKGLDVSGNSITDEGSYALSDYLRNQACHLYSLNLRSNQLTAQGVRRLAVALESNVSRSIKQVLLRKEGIIEALGEQGELPSGDNDAAGGTTSSTSSMGASSAGAQQSQLPSVHGSTTATTTAAAAAAVDGPLLTPLIVVDARDNLLGSRRLDEEDGLSKQRLAAPRDRYNARPERGAIPRVDQASQQQLQLQAQRQYRNSQVAEAYSSRSQPRIL